MPAGGAARAVDSNRRQRRSLGVWGYIAAAEELGGDLRERRGLSVQLAAALATGSAGTQTGLTAGAAIARAARVSRGLRGL